MFDDDRAVVIAPDVLEVVEGDAAGTAYTVKLVTEPAAAVTVTVSWSGGHGFGVGRVERHEHFDVHDFELGHRADGDGHRERRR